MTSTTFGDFDAVVFDLFGTLVQNSTVTSRDANFRHMAEALDIPPQVFKDEFVRLWSSRADGTWQTVWECIEGVCASLGLYPSDQAIKEATRLRHDAAKSWLEPRHDALETLDSLRSKGLAIGLISDCPPEVPEVWNTSVLSAYIAAPTFSCQVKLRKPDRRIYQLTVANLGTTPDNCLYVGDGSSDELNGATRAGLTAVMIDAPSETGELLMPTVRTTTWNGPVISALKALV